MECVSGIGLGWEVVDLMWSLLVIVVRLVGRRLSSPVCPALCVRVWMGLGKCTFYVFFAVAQTNALTPMESRVLQVCGLGDLVTSSKPPLT